MLPPSQVRALQDFHQTPDPRVDRLLTGCLVNARTEEPRWCALPGASYCRDLVGLNSGGLDYRNELRARRRTSPCSSVEWSNQD